MHHAAVAVGRREDLPAVGRGRNERGGVVLDEILRRHGRHPRLLNRQQHAVDELLDRADCRPASRLEVGGVDEMLLSAREP
eukprot:3287444-Prymnesium_polylepis.1